MWGHWAWAQVVHGLDAGGRGNSWAGFALHLVNFVSVMHVSGSSGCYCSITAWFPG